MKFGSMPKCTKSGINKVIYSRSGGYYDQDYR